MKSSIIICEKSILNSRVGPTSKIRVKRPFYGNILNFFGQIGLRFEQTVQIQIRLLLEEQSDLHVVDKIPSALASLFEFQVNYSKVSCVRKFRNFTVLHFSIGFAWLINAHHAFFYCPD